MIYCHSFYEHFVYKAVYFGPMILHSRLWTAYSEQFFKDLYTFCLLLIFKQDFLFIFPFSSTITDTTIYKTTLKKTNVVFLGVEWWCLKERDDVLENPHGLLLSLPQMLLLLCKFLSHWLGLLFLFNLLNLFEKTYQVKHNKESVRKKSWPILWVLKMKNSERKILQSEQWTEICPGLFCMFRDFSK